MGLYFQNISVSDSCSGRFSSPFYWDDEKNQGDEKKQVFVQLNHGNIKFYYEEYINEHPVSPPQQEVFLYIPLSDPQRTGYSLLNISSGNSKLVSNGDITGYRLHYADVVNTAKMFEDLCNSQYHTFYELLLCFFDDINNPDSDIRKHASHLAEQILQNLKKCMVYELIRRKYSFYEDLKDFYDSDKHNAKKGELSITFNIFLDEIIQGKIQQLISGYCMGEDKWFSTPENELESLFALNKKYNINEDRSDEIKKQFLKKHAVYSAMKLTAKNPWLPVSANIVAFLLYTVVFVAWLNNFYENTFWFAGMGFIIFIIGFIIHCIQQKFNISMILPRIPIAVASGWFMLILSEEILKNQLLVNKTFAVFTIPVTCALLIAFLFAEIRQHSPYFIRQKGLMVHFRKAFFILIYTFNLTVTLGFIAHHTIVDGYILKSKVFEDYIYSNKKDNLKNIISSLERYRGKLITYNSANATSFSIIRQERILLIDSVNKQKSSKEDLSIKKMMPSFITTYNNRIFSLKEADKIVKDVFINYNYLIDTCNLIPLKNEVLNASIKWDTKKWDSISDNLKVNDSLIGQLIKLCDSVIEDFKNYELITSDVDTLISYNTFNEDETIRLESRKDLMRLGFGDSVIIKIKKCDNNSIAKDCDSIEARNEILRYRCTKANQTFICYPLMLIFQVMLVMLFAILGQLIISEKTVTESL